MKNLGAVLLNFLFPIYCVGCREEKTHCCEKCLAEIPLLREKCFLPPPGKFAFDQIISAAKFEENSRIADLIHRFKYDGAKEIAATLALLMASLIEAIFAQEKTKNVIFVPVPLHKKRQNFRGFNQSELLASELAKLTGEKGCQASIQFLLQRHRYTRPQVELNSAERKTNLLDAFSVADPASELNSDLEYFIVDDVFTTGSTINECAKVLKNHGAKKVNGLTIARTAQ